MPDRALSPSLSLWGIWWNAILLLRPAFSRLRTFLWFVTAVAGLTVRVDLLGVTSIVRALNLRSKLYTKLLQNFHSSGIKLDRLSALWARTVLQLFPSPVRVNGRLVLVGDGIKAPKRGKKMPAVKLLHQQSESNTKPSSTSRCVCVTGRRLAMLMKPEVASDHKDGTVNEFIVVVAFAVIGLAVSLGFTIAFQISSVSALSA